MVLMAIMRIVLVLIETVNRVPVSLYWYLVAFNWWHIMSSGYNEGPIMVIVLIIS